MAEGKRERVRVSFSSLPLLLLCLLLLAFLLSTFFASSWAKKVWNGGAAGCGKLLKLLFSPLTASLLQLFDAK